MIEKLESQSGDVRRILGVRHDNRVDLSGAEWSAERSVLRGLVFDGFVFADTKIRPVFVGCEFRRCSFSSIQAEGTFWGAMNLWSECSFDLLRMHNVSSPQNRFSQCSFSGAELRQYSPCETAFVDCSFDAIQLVELKVQQNFRNSSIRRQLRELWSYPELPSMDSCRLSLLFRRCGFLGPAFSRCSFTDTAFEETQVLDPVISKCSFERVLADDQWWEQAEEKEMTTSYMENLLKLVEERLGRDSWTYSRLISFVDSYSGRFLESDWLEELTENGIPDSEYEVVDRIVDELDEKHR